MPIFKVKGNYEMESSEIWGITSFYNPVGYKNKYENFKHFRTSCKKQGLPLVVVEFVLAGTSFELGNDDGEIVIKITGNDYNILWQKERMLNIALQNLPLVCKKVVWLDCDVVFLNEKWVSQTSQLLNKYLVVQPFDSVIRLKRKQKLTDYKDLNKVENGFLEGQKAPGFAYSVDNKGQDIIDLGWGEHGHPGFAWAARREVFDGCGLYDGNLLGAGDTLMAYAFFGRFNTDNEVILNKENQAYFSKWAGNIFKRVRSQVGFTPGIICHLWHGDIKFRNYHKISRGLDQRLVPLRDTFIDNNGLWAIKKGKEDLIPKVRAYFFERKEGELSSFGLFCYFNYMFSSRFFLKKMSELVEFKNQIFGMIGRYINKVSPNLYKVLIRFKPKWM